LSTVASRSFPPRCTAQLTARTRSLPQVQRPPGPLRYKSWSPWDGFRNVKGGRLAAFRAWRCSEILHADPSVKPAGRACRPRGPGKVGSPRGFPFFKRCHTPGG
jgi:hypothetical protein